MIHITDENKKYYFPIDIQPTDTESFILNLYSELSLSDITFNELSGEVEDDYIGIVITTEMAVQVPNGEYNYTLYDGEGERVGIGLIRFDLEDGGTYPDEPEYVVYDDEMDGYLTTKDMSEYEEEIAELEEEIVIKDAIISGLQEEIDSVTATTINFNGVFTPAEGTLGWNSVDVQVKDYCYFKSLENNNRLGIDINDPSLHIDMEYSINKGDWVNWDFTDITLQSGDTVYLRGNNPSGTCSEQNYNYKARFTTSGNFDLGGNFVSLFDKTVTATACPNYEYCFNRLFQNCNIVHINKYFLSQLTTLSPKCYSGMFQGCMFMENTPELPATALTEECYGSMFRGCTSLTTIPDLPATTLTKSCYSRMFYACTGLVDLSNVTLPATTLAVECYETMFGVCKNLQKAPYLPATTLVQQCYVQMFMDCRSINYIRCNAITKGNVSTNSWLRNYQVNGTFVKNINATGWTVESGETIDGIPSGWNVLNDDTPITSTTINSNGVFLASGTTWDSVTVNVPTGITPSGTIEITQNGNYDVTNKASAVVNVHTGITPSGTIQITGNSNYDVSQYQYANVNVPTGATYNLPSFGVYSPPILNQDNTLKYDIPFGFYLENVPSGYTLTFNMCRNRGLTEKFIINYGDGTTYESTGATGYTETLTHTYTDDFSGWVYLYNPYGSNLHWGYGQDPFGNIFDYCKSMFVDYTDVGCHSGGIFMISSGGMSPSQHYITNVNYFTAYTNGDQNPVSNVCQFIHFLTTNGANRARHIYWLDNIVNA